jgi:hypothetical protein
MVQPSIPHGFIRLKYERSVATFNAKPCDVTSADANAERSDLLLAHPHAAMHRVTRRLDAKIGQGVDQTCSKSWT